MSIVESEVLDAERGIHVVSLNQPETLNSMTLEMGLTFHHIFQRLASLDPAPRAVILTGKNGVFSSGGDLKLLRSFTEKSEPDNQEFMTSFYRLFLTVQNMPFPTIACVNGHAVGASLALTLACDLRYFTSRARYAFNFVRIGIHPGMGSTFLLPAIAGLNHAQELLFTGRYFSGTEALRRGLCHGAFNAKDIFNKTVDLAREVAAGAPQAMRLLKQNLYRSHTLEAALAYESEAQAETFSTQDFADALDAIEQKKPPIFHDR